MAEKIAIDSLVLEVTRKCNMNCRHCLRGQIPDDGPLFMPKSDIAELLRHVKRIGNITFSGGEPSLAVPQIRHALTTLKRYKIPVMSFFIATNGKVVSDAFLKAMDDLYLCCMKWCIGDTERKDTASLCRYAGSVALSIDRFHEGIPMENILKLKSRSYFSESKMDIGGNGYYLNRGNAVNADIPRSQLIEREVCKLAVNDGEIETLYMNTHGDLLADCNLPYSEQSRYSIGKIHDKSVFGILAECINAS